MEQNLFSNLWKAKEKVMSGMEKKCTAKNWEENNTGLLFYWGGMSMQSGFAQAETSYPTILSFNC